MTDMDKNQDKDKTPPKINIDGIEDPSESGEESADKQSEETSQTGETKSSGIDSEPQDIPPKAKKPLQGRKLSAAKSDTSRIDLSEATQSDQEDKKTGQQGKSGGTQKIELPSDLDEEALEKAIQQKFQAAKEQTQRVSLLDTDSPDQSEEEDTDEEPKDKTSEIDKAKIVEEDDKSEEKHSTTPIQPPAQKEDTDKEPKDKTSEIDKAKIVEEDDRSEEKHSTIPIQPPAQSDEDFASAPPKTVKLKKQPQEQKPKEKEPEQKTPETYIPETGFDESKKSETVRIDIPKGGGSSAAPPTQRKTIRIKRPAGAPAMRPSLTVARPQKSEKRPTSSEDTLDGEEVGVATSTLALVATLAAVVLVYVLAASLIPELPFPGRLT